MRSILARRRPDVAVDIGDDAAVLSAVSEPLVWTVDAAVEGVHFRPEWLTWREVGFRSFVAAASDLAAMGAAAYAAVLSLTLPHEFHDESLFDLVRGVADAADRARTSVVGGNLTAGKAVSVHTSLLGTVTGSPLTRAGAKSGDTIYVTGAPGAAALGLCALQANRLDVSEFVRAWKRPPNRLARGRELLGVASAAVDLSDGLIQDLGHVCEASGVGAVIELGQVPVPQRFDQVAAELAADPVWLTLAGGESYELLFTVAEGVDASHLGCPIGTVREQLGVEVIAADGRTVDEAATRVGYQHFTSQEPNLPK